MMAALGALLRRLATSRKEVRIGRDLQAQSWIEACEVEMPEVRVAAALASLCEPKVGSLRDNLFATGKAYSWFGRDLSDRMISVLERRLRTAAALEEKNNPFGGACRISAGDATRFIEGSTDDATHRKPCLRLHLSQLDRVRFDQIRTHRSSACLCAPQASVSARND